MQELGQKTVNKGTIFFVCGSEEENIREKKILFGMVFVEEKRTFCPLRGCLVLTAGRMSM